MKYFNPSNLLVIPFIIVPFLISGSFQDPTLLIKRSSIFIIFFSISLFLYFLKIPIKQVGRKNIKLISIPIIFVLLMLFVSHFNAVNLSESYWELLYLIGWIGVYLVFVLYSSQSIVQHIIIISSIVGALLSLILINESYQLISFFELPFSSLSATFGNSNFFGQYLCFVIPASIISIFIVRSKPAKSFMLMCFILSLFGLALTRTKAAWIGVVFSIFIFIYYNRNKFYVAFKKFKVKRVIILISIVFTFYMIIAIRSPITKNSVLDTFFSIPSSKWKQFIFNEYDIKSENIFEIEKSLPGYFNIFLRIGYYESTINMIKDNMLIGIGLGNWRLIFPNYNISPFSKMFDNKGLTTGKNILYTDAHFDNNAAINVVKQNKDQFIITQRPHDDFLWLLAEVGLLGIIFVIYFLYLHFKRLLLLIRNVKRDSTEYYLLLFMMMSICSIIVESFFDFPRQRAVPNLYMWSMLGCIASWDCKFNYVSYKSTFFILLLISFLSIASIFSYFDIKSHLYSQEARYYNDKNMSNELFSSSVSAISYYRTVDYAGTPLFYYAGIAKYKMGYKKSAELLFQKAKELAPYHLGVLTNYMIVLADLGQLDKAYKILDKIRTTYPMMTKPSLDMAKFYLKAGKIDKAEEVLLQLRKYNLDNELGMRKSLFEYLNEIKKNSR